MNSDLSAQHARREMLRTSDIAKPATGLPPVFYDWSLAFENEMTQKGLVYWNEQRGHRPMPQFKDLKLREMKEFISNVSLIDSGVPDSAPPDYSIRLTGEHVRERYGAVAHRALHEFLPPEMERRWRDALDLVREKRAPLRVHGHMSYADCTWLYQETLLTPLSDAAGRVSMLFLVTAWRSSES